jgi:hypothetical protein
MEIPPIVVNAIVSLFVGGASAWFAGKLGVSRGLEQAKRQKALEQSLEWHLRTVRVMKKFQMEMAEYLSVAKESRDDAIPIAEKVEPTMVEFLMCASEAVLFTGKANVRRLTEGAKNFCDTLHDARNAMLQGAEWEAVLKRTATSVKLIESLEFELVCKYREQLGLEKIAAKDLGANDL